MNKDAKGKTESRHGTTSSSEEESERGKVRRGGETDEKERTDSGKFEEDGGEASLSEELVTGRALNRLMDQA
jgi:hypothetical protein